MEETRVVKVTEPCSYTKGGFRSHYITQRKVSYWFFWTRWEDIMDYNQWGDLFRVSYGSEEKAREGLRLRNTPEKLEVISE